MNIQDSMGTMSSYVNVNVFTKTTSTLRRLLFCWSTEGSAPAAVGGAEG